MRLAMRQPRVFACVLAVLTGLLLAPSAARAHGVNTCYVTLTVLPDRLAAEMSFTLADMTAHLQLDTNHDNITSLQEVQTALPAIFSYVTAHVTVMLDGALTPLTPDSGTITQSAAHQEFVTVSLHAPLRHEPSAVALSSDLFDSLGSGFSILAKLLVRGTVQQVVLSIDHPRQTLNIQHPRPLSAQLGEFLHLGIKHIFLGYDHILFLIALIIIGGRFGTLVKIVSAFTVAHSITLILAALQIVTLPSRFVESGIALSIAYVAGENLFRRGADHRWILTFCFGLVHGFGFANVLRELGLPTRGLVASLLSFNAGVEVGQLCIVAILFPVTRWLAKTTFQRSAVVAVSLVVFVCGTLWFVERAFALKLMPF